ncbi:hypothetical protein [Lyticum sinuosum]|uniref:Uncharacterized protein n=1 Tax=Lyticum sinuosum TaxID=1332059 RepID=A0AAE4VKM7_9RICK|nr:hypothetical protein [Lyticum sinuosum]MDZ5761607.1 hypothetical protein [Lyticum sinuosum]
MTIRIYEFLKKEIAASVIAILTTLGTIGGTIILAITEETNPISKCTKHDNLAFAATIASLLLISVVILELILRGIEAIEKIKHSQLSAQQPQAQI